MYFIGSPGEIIVKGSTVGDCLKDFTRQFPGSDKWVFHPGGKLHEQVFVYINMEGTHSASLDDAVKAGDNLFLVALIVGG